MPERYPLPDVINPPSSLCVCIAIPDDAGHRQAFLGAIYSLSKWYSWQYDDAHTGKAVASVWRPIFQDVVDQLGERQMSCMSLEFRMSVCGILEYSLDGSTWIPIPDLNSCFVAINPNTTDRNIIIPLIDGVVPLSVKQFAGSTIDVTRFYASDGNVALKILSDGRLRGMKSYAVDALLSGEMWSIYATTNTVSTGNGTLTYQPRLNFGHAWLGGVSSVVRKMILSASGRLGIGESLTATNLLAYLHIFPTLSSEIGAIIRAAASQTANLLELHTSANLFLSGIDSVGRFIFAVGSGKPTDTIVRPGTTRIDAALEKIWVKGPNSGSDDWWSIESGEQITGANATTLDPGEPATAEIVDGVLELGIPQGETGEPGIPGVPGANGIKFLSFRPRPSPAETVEFEIPILADGWAYLPYQVENGDQIEFMELTGWWSDDAWTPSAITSPNIGYEPDGSEYGQPPETYTYDAGDPLPSAPHMALLVAYRGNSAYALDPVEVGNIATITDLFSAFPYIWLYPNVATLDGNAGGIVAKIQFTAAFACAEFEFITDEGGYHVVELADEWVFAHDTGEYTPSVGFTQLLTTIPDPDEVVATAFPDESTLYISPKTVYSVKVHYSASVDVNLYVAYRVTPEGDPVEWEYGSTTNIVDAGSHVDTEFVDTKAGVYGVAVIAWSIDLDAVIAIEGIEICTN